MQAPIFDQLCRFSIEHTLTVIYVHLIIVPISPITLFLFMYLRCYASCLLLGLIGLREYPYRQICYKMASTLFK